MNVKLLNERRFLVRDGTILSPYPPHVFLMMAKGKRLVMWMREPIKLIMEDELKDKPWKRLKTTIEQENLQ